LPRKICGNKNRNKIKTKRSSSIAADDSNAKKEISSL
jgi:hypothetical protein